MQVTEIRIALSDAGRLKAFVSLVFDGQFAVRGIKVIQGNSGRLFLAMPSRKKPDNTYHDIVHPVTPEFRNYLEAVVLDEYTRLLRSGAQVLEPSPPSWDPGGLPEEEPPES